MPATPRPRTKAAPDVLRTAGLDLICLGTKGGPPPSPDATGISSALVVDGAVYLVDVGRSAVTQYVRSGLKFRDLRGVFITHLHADHVADYFNLFLLAGNGNPAHRDSMPDVTSVWGPGPAGGLPDAFGGRTPAVEHPEDPTPGIRGLTDHASAAFAYSTNLFIRDSHVRPTRGLAEVHEIDVSATGATYRDTHPDIEPFLVMEDEHVRVTATLVPHGPVFPAFAYRFDTRHGSVTFSGDTTYSDNLIRLARDTDVLVHEAINVDGFQGPPALVDHLLEGHVEIQKVGGIAQRAGAKRLVVSHIGDLVRGVADLDEWADWAQIGYDGPVHVAAELDLIRIG